MSDEEAVSDPKPVEKPKRRKPAAQTGQPEIAPIVLNETQRSLVDELLFSEGDEGRGAVVERMGKLPDIDRENVGGYLIQQLKTQPDAVLRSWMVSAIGATHPQGGAEAISRLLDARREDDSMVRFWAAIRLAQLAPENLKDRLNQLRRHEEDAQVVAVSLRLLMESTNDEAYFEEWHKMAEASDWYSRFAACKVLRKQYGLHSMASWETRILNVLRQRITEESETLDVKYQAALALGDGRRVQRGDGWLGWHRRDRLPPRRASGRGEPRASSRR